MALSRPPHKPTPAEEITPNEDRRIDEIAARVAEHLTPARGVHLPDVPTPAPAAFTPESKITGSIRDVMAALAAIFAIAGVYFTLRGDVVRADSQAAAASDAAAKLAAEASKIALKVADHETELKVSAATTRALKEDLDRRFEEVKDAQKASEDRIIQAVNELKREVRKGK